MGVALVAVVLLSDGFEEVEAIVPVDILRRAGVTVQLVAVGGDGTISGAHGIAVAVDGCIGECAAESFAALIIPGGRAVAALRKSEEVRRLVVGAFSAKKLIGAICAAPTILMDNDLLAGHRFTAYPGCVTGADESKSTIESGQIVTGRDPGAAAQFGLTIARRLVGAETAASVASTMGYPQQWATAPNE
ncbi:MAG: DJ-1/PfpI family protein [Puniceicoccales bacterium]|jgi:4-methyl-5(b-hydroxyethyl)-thiazole monophosphate biosynthesis|nr:DJ-1/PfpI family protein [Puniceicoccales bacterium]